MGVEAAQPRCWNRWIRDGQRGDEGELWACECRGEYGGCLTFASVQLRVSFRPKMDALDCRCVHLNGAEVGEDEWCCLVCQGKVASCVVDSSSKEGWVEGRGKPLEDIGSCCVSVDEVVEGGVESRLRQGNELVCKLGALFCIPLGLNHGMMLILICIEHISKIVQRSTCTMQRVSDLWWYILCSFFR